MARAGLCRTVFRGFKVILPRRGVGTRASACHGADPREFSAELPALTVPGLDGAEVLRILRTTNPDVSAFILTGFSEQDVFARVAEVFAL